MIHDSIVTQPRQILCIAEEQLLNQLDANIEPFFTDSHSTSTTLQLEHISKKINEAWLTNSAVNFCAKAYPSVSMAHEDAAALVILGAFLRNGILHKSIREQGGAYGGGASQDSNNACFRFYSYRDPRMSETLDDFDASVAWLLENKHTTQKLEEAILGTVSSLDRSESPAGRAKRCFHAELNGRKLESRKLFRERVLATTMSDLKRVAEKYLREENASVAIVTDKSNKAQVQKLGLTVQEL